MNPRLLALIAGTASALALGAAIAAVLPQDRSRWPIDAPQPPREARPEAPPARPGVRDVTPRAGGEAQPSIPTPTPGAAQAPTAQTPAPGTPPNAPISAPVPRPAPNARAPGAAPEIIADLTRLDPRIQRTRERLLEAARTGDLARLAIVFQMSETTPVFTRGSERDPVAFWRQASGDGEGAEILAILIDILEMPAAVVNRGGPQEMTVFPYLAQRPLAALTREETIDLYRLMTAQDVRDMRAIGAWVFWRLGIGRDGTIHYFLAGE